MPLFPHVPSKREPLFPHRTAETGMQDEKHEYHVTITAKGIEELKRVEKRLHGLLGYRGSWFEQNKLIAIFDVDKEGLDDVRQALSWIRDILVTFEERKEQKPSYLKEATAVAEPETEYQIISPQYYDLIGFISEPLLPAIEPEEGERKIDAVLRQLKDGVESIQQSERFRLFLTTMSKFHDYSFGNQILIMLQQPNATHVAGFVTWKELGRWVKRGEKGISILAPRFPPRPTCPKCGAKVPKGAGFCPKCGASVEEGEIGVEPAYFIVVSIFDISQTEGEPLPEFEVPVLTGAVNEELFSKLLALMKAKGIPVSFESQTHLDPAIKGQYSPATGIWVRPEEPRAQQLKSLAHEIAHYYSEGVFRIPRHDAETIAESAAYVIGAHYGFDSGVRSFPYVALWAQDKKVLEKNLEDIRKVATTIMEALG